MTRSRAGCRDEQGAVAVIVAMSTMVMFMMAALVVDLGHARDVRRQAQNAADASALAAGNALYSGSAIPKITEAVAAAKAHAFLEEPDRNVTDAEWAACTDSQSLRVTAAGTACISFQNSADPSKDASKPDTVRVKMPGRSVTLPFGALAGVSTSEVTAQAEIGLNLGTAPTCSLCVLGPGPHDLQNGNTTVTGGSTHFNGSVSLSSGGSITTSGKLTVQGTASGSSTSYSPAPLTNQPPITDPLAFMPMPDVSGLSTKSDPCTQGPGKYGSVDLRNRNCVLSPGLYVIAGGTSVWLMEGSSTTVLSGSGVTLYFTCGTPAVPTACASGQVGGTIYGAGNARLQIVAPTSGPLQGIALLFDRNNAATLRLAGNAATSFTGTLYAPRATLQMNGNGCGTAIQAMIVVWTIAMNGNPACLKSDYARSVNADLPADQLHLTR